MIPVAPLHNTPSAKRQWSATTNEDVKKRFRAMTAEELTFSSNDDVVARKINSLSTTVSASTMDLVCADDPARMDPECVMNEHQQHYFLKVYDEIQQKQQVTFRALGLGDNHAKAFANVSRHTLEIAGKNIMKKETLYTGLYLYYTYMAHVRMNCEEDSVFTLYKDRKVMNMKSEDFSRVLFPISIDFNNNRTRNKNELLIATTCLCIAAKMEENQFASMIKPSAIISQMKTIGHHLGRHNEFDFVTVERDILEQLQWRLFRVETPLYFLQMMFAFFHVSIADRLETHKILAICLSSQEYVLTTPPKLAAYSLMAALHKNRGADSVVTERVNIAKFANISIIKLLIHTKGILELARLAHVQDTCDSCEVEETCGESDWIQV